MTLKTKSFELAVYSAGNESAARMALVLPGRLDTKDYVHMRSHVDFLGGQGFYALSFDPPGTWESPGDISLYTQQNYLHAVDELVELFGNKPTLVMGHSRGGSTALVAGVTNPHVSHIVAVMSHFGPSEMGEAERQAGAKISYRDMPPGAEKTAERKRFDLPLSYYDDPTTWSGLEHCTKPKLFFLGLHDDTVLPSDVREVYAIAAEPKRLVELDCDHDYRYRPDMIELVNKTLGQWLK